MFGTDIWYTKTYCVTKGQNRECVKYGRYFRELLERSENQPYFLVAATFDGGGALLSELYGIFQRSSDEVLQNSWAFDAVLTSVFVIHRWVFRAMVLIPDTLQCSSD